ncbi:MAG: hypothetical protein HZC41_04725 [Chloroflexi bacterium]|nr:hypothetical protein [Chloroflexota bacterium]
MRLSLMRRLHLRENWPLFIAGIAFALMWISYQSLRATKRYRPWYGETVNYWEVATRSQQDNDLNRLTLVFIVLVGLLALISVTSTNPYKKLIAVGVVLFSTLCTGSICIVSGLLPQDGTTLAHIQTERFSGRIYQLAKGDTVAGGADVFYSSYFLYECDSEGIKCQIIYETEKYYDRRKEERAVLVSNNSLDQLYLQVGSENVYEVNGYH